MVTAFKKGGGGGGSGGGMDLKVLVHGQLTFKCGQLFAMANKDSSVINVPPILRCCKELALDICTKQSRIN